MAEGSKANICEEELFNEVFRKHSKDLFNFLYYKFGADNNPQDLVQEAFLKLWKNCQNVVPEKARSFLFTIANNQMLNEVAKKKTVLNYSQNKPKEHTIETPEYLMEETEYLQRLQKAIEDLPDGQRTAFLLNRIEGKKHLEIAEMLGISRKAVEKRIYGAVAALKKKLDGI
ncbi:RNA polymerase sigma factor [Fulvivirgaceae bacterium BMA10]|uniref:RNA polymerase sigma factor n=1 Tax=Splendidivirga corallicola TaxID=3051826 RepID=A0ABT8KT42_9BACT|nr:RNA polymerase sigma factor [Fulvivirgaceae bacterium BMA10]